MPETSIIDVGFQILTHAGQVGISHLGKRLDATIPRPPEPPQFTPPAWHPPAFQPLGGSPTLADQHTTAEVTLPRSPMPAARTGQSYSDQVAQGVACLNCTRGHVSTAKTAAERAVQALQSGDATEARRQWAIVAAEYDALKQYDWDPSKLAASPPEDQAIIAQVRECVAQAREQVPTPESVALSYGSASESERFAVSSRFTERDAQEIHARHQEIDSRGNYAERAELLHDTSPEAQQAKNALREARHVLDRAGSEGSLYRPEVWSQASAYFEQAAVAVTPTPTLGQAEALAAQCASCSEDFYRLYFAKQVSKRHEQGG